MKQVSTPLVSPPSRWAALHPAAWLAWLAAALVMLSLTRNPVYLLLLLAGLGVVLWVVRRQAYAPALPVSPLRFAALVVSVSALFNALTTHVGDTVLFRLPAWLPLVGGAITLEALVYGALNGLVLAGFFAAFTVLYLAVPTQALIRLVPRAFTPVAVVISVAVAFVPTTLAQFQQVREAQLLRGHRVRGVRDWLPLLMPLLVGGLERALQLAEAMTARGFGSMASAEPSQRAARRNLPIVVGLFLLLGGLLIRLFWRQQAISWALLILGGGLLIGALWLQGRSVPRSVYRPQPWTPRDWLVLAMTGLALSVYLLPWPGVNRGGLAYSPYPRLSLPEANLLLALASAAIAIPALIYRTARQ